MQITKTTSDYFRSCDLDFCFKDHSIQEQLRKFTTLDNAEELDSLANTDVTTNKVKMAVELEPANGKFSRINIFIFMKS